MTVKELKNGLGLMLAPGNSTKRALSIGDAYAQYYKTTLIPLVIYILLSFVFVSAAGYSLIIRSVTAPLLGLGLFAAIAVPIVFVWILLPIGAFIDAAIYHIVGRAVGAFKFKFENTLSAMLYGLLPVGIFSFVLAVPFATPIYPIFGLWSLIVGIVAIANLQKTSWTVVFGVILMSAAIVLTLIALIASVLAISLGSTFSSWLMTHHLFAWPMTT